MEFGVRNCARRLTFESLEQRAMLHGGVPLADFSLLDVNPTSSTAGTNVSPRDHLGEVSAWYFGHAT